MVNRKVVTGNLYGAPVAYQMPIIWALTDAGFSRSDAETWAYAWIFIPEPGLAVVEVTSFDDHGIPIDIAVGFHQLGFMSGDASCYYDAKYTPQQAATVRDLAVYEEDIDDWLATGLPAERVIAYLRADVNVDEALDFENTTFGPDGPDEPHDATVLHALMG